MNTTVSYTYNGTGVFTVALTDFGPVGGPQTSTRINYIVVTNLPAQLTISPTTLNFGALPVGQSSTQSFSVINSGQITLSGTVTAGGGTFSIVSGTPYNLSGGQTGTVNVAFSPSTVGNFTNSIVFASNGGSSTNAVIGSGATIPSASFSGTPTTGLVSLAVIFTDSSTGTITNRSWTFGDGGSTNTLNTTVAYTYNSVGTDTVTLVVAGPLGVSTNTRVNYIVVTNGPPQLLVAPGSFDFGLLPVGQSSTQVFSLANAGSQTLSGTATASSAPFAIASGSPYTMNSMQTGSVKVSFSPMVTGAFTGSVVFSSNGGVSTNTVTGSAAVAPIAGFTGSPTNGAATLLVNFTDTSSGTVTSQVWTFGDGGTSTLASPSHPYTNAGKFSVSLTVSGPLGSNTLLLANLITVTNLVGAPIAGFIASPRNGAVPLLVNFTDASMGSITNRSWTFGDGGVSTLTSPSHTYSNAGIYSVALTVAGPGGSSMTNLANLITVTNLVGTAPTVTIVRPANGMMYPPVTNLTITMRSALQRPPPADGAAINKIEFFADGVKLGETTSNLGTNLFINPTLGTHAITGLATDALGGTNTSLTITITVGAKNSPWGDWQVTISGADRGAQFLNFADDFSASGFAIRLKTFGLEEVSGRWGFNSKGQVTGPFLGQTDDVTNWTENMFPASAVRSLKSLSGVVPTSAFGNFHWRGIPTTTFSDLSGTWTGLVTVARETPVAVSYLLSADANDLAVFSISTTTAGASTPWWDRWW